MSFKTFLTKVGLFFVHLFEGAKKTWKRVSPEIQAALIYGSGVIDIINTNIDKAPPFIIQLIQERFPQYNLEHLKTALTKASADLKTGAEDVETMDVESLIGILQTYLPELKSKSGITWAKISHFLAAGIAAFTAPQGTKFALIASLLEFVYQTFIKRDQAKA